MSHRRETMSSRADDRSEGEGYSWNLSTVFGAAVVAAVGIASRSASQMFQRPVGAPMGGLRASDQAQGRMPSR